jgi:hypothetical protein
MDEKCAPRYCLTRRELFSDGRARRYKFDGFY